MKHNSVFIPPYSDKEKVIEVAKRYFDDRFIEMENMQDNIPIAFQNGEYIYKTDSKQLDENCIKASFIIKDFTEEDAMLLQKIFKENMNEKFATAS